MYYVYVLQSKVRSWRYVGSTNNIERRFVQHNIGRSKATRPYAPFELVYFEEFESRPGAAKRELYFKTGVGREELDKIIRGRSSAD